MAYLNLCYLLLSLKLFLQNWKGVYVENRHAFQEHDNHFVWFFIISGNLHYISSFNNTSCNIIPKTMKDRSMSRAAAVGDTFLCSCERGHCSLTSTPHVLSWWPELLTSHHMWINPQLKIDSPKSRMYSLFEYRLLKSVQQFCECVYS